MEGVRADAIDEDAALLCCLPHTLYHLIYTLSFVLYTLYFILSTSGASDEGAALLCGPLVHIDGLLTRVEQGDQLTTYLLLTYYLPTSYLPLTYLLRESSKAINVRPVDVFVDFGANWFLLVGWILTTTASLLYLYRQA